MHAREMRFFGAFPSHVRAVARTTAETEERCPASLSLCPFPKLPRREAQPATLPQTHVPAAPSFPPPPPREHNVPLIHHSACSTPALCLCHRFFWLDFLAILVTVHHRLARKSDFSTLFFFFLKKPSSRGMGDLELLRILLLIISTLIVSFHIHSCNDKQI